MCYNVTGKFISIYYIYNKGVYVRMCGIVGYIGRKDARSIVLDGLSLLEYRGYDSAGVCLRNEENNSFHVYKNKGRVKELKEHVDFDYETHLAIGHTRWATHGKPNYVNSHPHFSQSKRFIIVHNGVIENAKKIKIELLKNFQFRTETDTEVIANLIELNARKMSVSNAIRRTLTLLEGSYALLILDSENPDTIYVAKNRTPLIIGMGDGITIASDTMALIGHADKYLQMADKTFAVIKNGDFEYSDIIGMEKEKEFTTLDCSKDVVEKGSYPHYMLKEIEEQPGVIRRLISSYFDDEIININHSLIEDLRASDKIFIIACGTSYYAGLLGKLYFESLCSIPVEVLIASEVAYFKPLMSNNPFFIFISQSGETADIITCLKKIRSVKYKSLAITNNQESSISRLASYSLDLMAGREIAVASTKAYIAQICLLSILAKEVSNRKTNLKANLSKVALAIEDVIQNKKIIENLALEIKDQTDAFYIGRGIDYYASLESALKLKELSYIHAEGYASGELKHGSIALIDEGYPVIAIITREEVSQITRSNLIEAESRGARGIVVSTRSIAHSDDDFVICDVASYLTPMVSVVFSQLLSYYVSIMRGNDVDKPKNLAKSVTVE